ncbi:MAG: deoxyhypusine synthase [Candidatus Aenigmarchaeota archaeon]|nr:deoxyhypusine synthase [Candidatus Aenigmarchaeota archaeon]
MHVSDFRWKRGMSAAELSEALAGIGFQSSEMGRAADNIVKMKKSGAKIFLTFTSNMVTSGLRGFFAQLIELGMADIIVTTAGGIEEDIMKALGEKFSIGKFHPDDTELYEQGINRVGNIYIRNESYAVFEEFMNRTIEQLYIRQKRWAASEFLNELGKLLKDEHSILYQAAKKSVPVFCPAITDGALGFHLFMFQQEHHDFVIDVVKDFEIITNSTTHDDKKGIIALGGGVSKHFAIFTSMLNGGMDYAVYMTTSSETSGSASGATTDEAKSWGKIKDECDAVTVIGDVTITFPVAMASALEALSKEAVI